MCCGLNLSPSNNFAQYLNTLNSDLRSFLDWEKICWDKDEELLSEFKKSIVGYKHAFLFSNACERFIQPYNENITQTFPHTWDSINNVANWSDDQDVFEYDPNEEDFVQEILPKSFYKESTKEAKEKRWEETCYFVSKDLIFVEEDDTFDDSDEDPLDDEEEDEEVDNV